MKPRTPDPESLPILIGVETEYGIHVERSEGSDVVADSIALVRCAAEPGVWLKWDYNAEDPHVDARGFRVRELRQDTDEADYVDQDSRRELSFVEIKSDLALGNGGRFYNDHAHPEYCTPECSNADDLVLHDRAGERLVMACASKLEQKLGVPVVLYKNNTDFCGHSYGCHENYLIPRSLGWDELARAVQAFLVTRQVFAGAGKFGVESEDHFDGPGFQISQRSDFFSELQSVDTMQRRPIINTRDEPHANPALYRRFHVILGDANMSPFATRLKVGTLGLVLKAIVTNPGHPWPHLQNPLSALRAISRDPSCKASVKMEGGRLSTALAVQREYLDAVEKILPPGSAELREMLTGWAGVLDDLEVDPARCSNRLDWVAKRELLHRFMAEQGVGPEDPWLRSLDLEYHRMDPASGLYYEMERAGMVAHGPAEADVVNALHNPPGDTRAAVRGRLIQKFQGRVVAAQWDHVVLEGSAGPVVIQLTDLFAREEIARYLGAIERALDPADLGDLDRPD